MSGALPTLLLCVLDVYRESFGFIFNLTNTVRNESHSHSAFDLLYTDTVELHLSGLIGTTSHPDTQKIRIIGFLFENQATLAV
jgi:hypothetical protein